MLTNKHKLYIQLYTFTILLIKERLLHFNEYLTLFWFDMLLLEYELEFKLRKIQNMQNLSKFYIIKFRDI